MTLADYIARHLRVPFSWGAHDCVTFASGWIVIKSGKNPIADLPAWGDEQEARRVIASVGGLDSAIDARLTRIHPNLARDGDIGIRRSAVGIFSGAHIVIPGETGLVFIDRTQSACAWQS